MTFTKEWLQKAISDIETMRDEIPFGLDEDESNTLEALKLALASLEAEPALYCMGVDALDEESASTRKAVVDGWVDEWNGEGRCPGEPQYRTIPLYTAPPAPVSVPDENKSRELFEKWCSVNTERNKWHPEHYAHLPAREQWNAWEACRAALLQGKAEPVSRRDELPMQPLVIDVLGTLRFKENEIVRKLLDYATEHGYGLNEMALENFTPDDRMQLAQLIGYSLTGYGELSYVTDESYDRAAAAAPQQEAK